jgi:hypothetical protein
LLKPQIEQFLPKVTQFGLRLGICQLTDFLCFHVFAYRRDTKRVAIGSFDAASRNDSLANTSVTPPNSNNTFPGRITATQVSGGPLPLPMRVSGGRLVIGLSGNTRIHNLPRRFMLRDKATRHASSCVVVTHARSSACNPYSPNATVAPRHAVPVRLPRWALRYFTLLGIIGIV